MAFHILKIKKNFKNYLNYFSYIQSGINPIRGYFPNYILSQRQEFHLVDPSPWPFIAAVGAFSLTAGGALFMHGYNNGFETLLFGFLIILFVMFVWWRDIIREGTYEGQHSEGVISNLKWGMLLFIISEVMFFFAFFWAFFHSSINPTIALGNTWPPLFITVLDPWKIPFLNTLLLLTSGASVTWAHHSIIWGSKHNAIQALIFTIILAIIFTAFQIYEYNNAPFSISDSVYGSVFYLLTGFHGFHVIIGTCFLIICTIRLYLNHFTREHHLGFEFAAWYWHFVDVVWLFLFITVYWLGS